MDSGAFVANHWTLRFALNAQFLAGALFVVAFALTAVNRKREGRRAWVIWKSQQVREFGKRSLIVGILVVIAAQLIWTFGAFWVFESFDAACNYGSFAFPCLAAMTVGRVLLQREQANCGYLLGAEFRAYLVSVGLLILGYAAYLKHNASEPVVNAALSAIAVSCFVPLIARRVWLSPSPWANRLVVAALGCLVGGFAIFAGHEMKWI